MASCSISFSVTPPGASRVTSTSSTRRSVRSFATASSRLATPLSGASALATHTMRPGTRSAVGGAKTSVSTPSGIVRSRPSGISKAVRMSSSEDFETVSRVGMRRATRACMRRNPYQRRRVSLRCNVGALARSSSRSRVIGWWIVATSGRPASAMRSRP